eukprot:1175919-Prorocentrum_minimum.AAC.5
MPSPDAHRAGGVRQEGQPDGASWRCMLAPHLAPFVQTPWFLLASRFDHWQLMKEAFLTCMDHEPYYPPYPSGGSRA